MFTALLISRIERLVIGGGRVRHQPGATSARTLQDSTEAEGEKLREHIYQKAEMKGNPVAYENPAQSVNITLDDVGVKKQKEERQSLDKSERENQEKQRKSAYQTVVHVGNQRGSYVFNALGVGVALQILLAFLLHNDLLQGKLMVFLDGQRSLHASVLEALSGWAPVQLILDWYHLEEKCKKQLSKAKE